MNLPSLEEENEKASDRTTVLIALLSLVHMMMTNITTQHHLNSSVSRGHVVTTLTITVNCSKCALNVNTDCEQQDEDTNTY